MQAIQGTVLSLQFSYSGTAPCRMCISHLLFVSEIIADQAHTLATLSLLFAFIPLFYLTGLTTKWVWRHNPVTQYCCRYIIRIRDVERSQTTATLLQAVDAKNQLQSVTFYGAV